MTASKWRVTPTFQNSPVFPPIEGVYVILLKDLITGISDVLYVGRSKDIRKRFACHRTYNSICETVREGFINSAYYLLFIKVKKTKAHKDLEKRLIVRLKPRYNKTHNYATK